MNLLFALNSGYVGPLCVCLRSIMSSNPGTRFDIYVAYSSLTKEDFERLEACVDRNRCTVIPIVVDNTLFESAEILKRTSKETYYRLLAMDFIPDSVDRILYLDPDIVVIKPLDGFYNIEFGNNLFAGAPHFKHIMNRYNSKRLHLPETVPYINAGVLMINLKELRECCSSAKIIQFIKTTDIRLVLADQDVLNAMFYGRLLAVNPLLYNLDEKCYIKSVPRIDRDWVDKHTVIIHYNGSKKPWKGKYKGNLGDYYYERCN